MTVFAFSCFITSIIAFLLGVVVVIKNGRETQNWTWFATSISVATWGLGLGMEVISSNYSQALFWNRVLYAGAIFIPIFYYHFALSTLRIQKERRFSLVLGYILFLLFFIVNITTQLFIKGVPPRAGFQYWAEAGPLYYLYFFFFVVFVAYSVYLMMKKFPSLSQIEKDRIKLIIFANLIGFGGGLTNFFPQLINANIYPYGNFFVVLYVFFMTYSILKYNLFNLKVIATELLIYAIWIFLVARTLLAETISDRIIDSTLLAAMVVFGILLIRSVRQEVKQRERIEKLAKELEGANEKLKELDQMKSEFLSLATHQIRAPLTAIKGYSSMLLEGDFGVLPQKATDSVQTIMKSCQNLINIVGDFLNISRIEQGRMVYEKSIFDMGELVREVANELEPNIKNAGLFLELEIPDNLSIKVNADRGKIKQVIGNIIDNAIKYTIRGSIKISVYKEHDIVKVAVKDSGIGIDPAEINKLFAKFSRTKDAGKTNVTGTGLGLYIAKKMAEAHRGDIKVFSDGVSKGTTFTVELPLYK